MELVPLRNQVALRVEAPKTGTDSGLIVTLREPPATGIVVAVGEGYYKPDGTLAPMPLEPGDRVHFNRTAGSTLEIEGHSILMIAYTDIFAVILP